MNDTVSSGNVPTDANTSGDVYVIISGGSSSSGDAAVSISKGEINITGTVSGDEASGYESGDVILDSHWGNGVETDGSNSGSLNVTAAGDLIITSHADFKDEDNKDGYYGLTMKGDIDVNLTASGTVFIESSSGDAINLNGDNSGDLKISGDKIVVIGYEDAFDNDSRSGSTNDITITAGSGGIIFYSKDICDRSGTGSNTPNAAVTAQGGGTMKITSTGLNAFISENKIGMRLTDEADGNVEVSGASNLFSGSSYGFNMHESSTKSEVSITASADTDTEDFSGGINEFIGSTAVNVAALQNNYGLTITASDSNYLQGSMFGLSATAVYASTGSGGNTSVSLTAQSGNNVIIADGSSGVAINAVGDDDANHSVTVNVSGSSNYIYGKDIGSNASSGASITVTATSGDNLIGFSGSFNGNTVTIPELKEASGEDGKYTYEISSGSLSKGGNTYTGGIGEIGIESTSGGINNYNALSGSNKILSSEKAIYASDAGSKVILDAAVNNGIYLSSDSTFGIHIVP